MSDRDLKCEDRVDESLEATIDTITKLWAGYTQAECYLCEGEEYIDISGDEELPDEVKWADFEIEVDCPECEDNALPGYTTVDCPDCDGEGEIADECFRCGGTEVVGIKEVAPGEQVTIDCPLCEGTGTTPESIPGLGVFYEYGLSFDYVAPGTFDDQDQGYFRYQLSYGGPSDEFRFYVNPDLSAYRIEYWFLDWFDGAFRHLRGTDQELIQDIYDDYFRDSGLCQSALDDASDY